MRDGATAGYRYFLFEKANEVGVTVRGTCKGAFCVRDERGGNVVATIPVSPSEGWAAFSAPLNIAPGKHPLYFTYEGEGWADVMYITLR